MFFCSILSFVVFKTLQLILLCNNFSIIFSYITRACDYNPHANENISMCIYS